MIYGIIGCFIIIGFLIYKLFQKQKIDTYELQKYQKVLQEKKEEVLLKDYEINIAKNALKDTKEKREYEEYKLNECKKDLQAALDTYNDITENKLKEIDTFISEQQEKREQQLNNILQEKQAHYDLLLQQVQNECEQQIQTAKDNMAEEYDKCVNAIAGFKAAKAELQQKFEGIERALRTYDAEQQAKLYYTIQLPEEYYEDIEFLLTTVAAKVQHPDIISKLVWQEYVKPNLENTFKRIEIKAEPGIYKLTSLLNGKCYIGKSTNVKNRITDHFKSVVGITSIADQAVHHAIRKEGFWNWTVEIITYCDKEQLSDLEKYYIDFFKAQEFGYNKTGGG